MCGENESYDTCGSSCPADCNNYALPRNCPKICRSGCFCNEGYVRDPETGYCIKVEECPYGMLASRNKFRS